MKTDLHLRGVIAISIIVSLGFFAVVGVVAFVPLPESAKGLLDILIGTLASCFTGIVHTWTGSPISSKVKDQTISDLAEAGKNASQAVAEGALPGSQG